MDNVKNINLDLSSIAKQKIVIDGDQDRVLFLNLSDMNMIVRLNDKQSELSELQTKAVKDLASSNKESKSKQEVLKNTAESLKEIDAKMRELTDYIFDSNVSEVCASFGSMFDVINGKPRYEHIFDALVKLYSKNIDEETKKISARVEGNKHTKKYIKSKKRK